MSLIGKLLLVLGLSSQLPALMLQGPSSGTGPFNLIVDTNYSVPLLGSPDLIQSSWRRGAWEL
jgi:hypothetical protein